MKELSIEEKAKAYDEAIKRAKKYYSTTDSSADIKLIGLIFPELKESEDERIRKKIINLVIKHSVSDERCMMTAWLEKQGEQNNTDKVEPKFHEGDIIKPKDRGHEPWQIMQVDILNKKYRFKDGYVIHFSQEDDYELVEQKPAEWSEKDKDTLRCIIDALDSLDIRTNTNGEHEDYTEEIYWLKSLKDRVQPKQEWSEEDEYHKRQILRILKDNGCSQTLQEKTEKWIEERLKSLRPQSTWRPSEE